MQVTIFLIDDVVYRVVYLKRRVVSEELKQHKSPLYLKEVNVCSRRVNETLCVLDLVFFYSRTL